MFLTIARTTGKGASKDYAKATSTKKRKQVDQTSISDRSCVSPRPVLDPAQGDIANPTLTHQTLQAEFNNLPVSDSARPYKPDRAEATGVTAYSRISSNILKLCSGI